MPWLLLLHILALIVWCGSLLYLPALIRSYVTSETTYSEPVSVNGEPTSMPRLVFNLIATPAALLAILAGTVVFLFNVIVEFWLLAKLTLVVLLVGCHALTGTLVVRVEKGRHRYLPQFCLALAVVIISLMVSIIWIVLAKPMLEA